MAEESRPRRTRSGRRGDSSPAGALVGGRLTTAAEEIARSKNRGAGRGTVKAAPKQVLSDLRQAIDAVDMGFVLLDADLKVETANRAYCELWHLEPGSVPAGTSFADLLEASRGSGLFPVSAQDWSDFVSAQAEEIRAGGVAPREFRRQDGSVLLYSVAALPNGKRFLTYFDLTGIKEREADLASALERAKLIDSVLDGVRDPIFVKDSDLRFVFVNRAFATLYGKQPQEMIGARGSDFLPEAQARLFEASERAVLSTGKPYEVEEDFEFSGIGRSRIVRKNRIETAGGRFYVASFLFDITEMKRRGQEADKARRQLANLVETMPAGIVIYDAEDRFLLANRAIHESLPALAPLLQPGTPIRRIMAAAHAAGYFRECGDPIVDALFDADPRAWIEAQVARYHQPELVSERRNADGHWFKTYDRRCEDGTFIGVRLDITDLKTREHELGTAMRENELFRSLIDNVPVSIYAKRPDLKLAYVNKGWCELTGFSREDAIGRTDIEVFGEEGRPFVESDLAVLRTGVDQVTEEVADGGRRHQISRKSMMTATDGSLYLIGSTTDITELKNRERELTEANRKAVLADRAKSEFLANMSHEIRTPMNGVLGMAELLAKSELSPRQKTFTDIIVKSGNALLTIINDILDFSKIDAGQLMLDPAPFCLAEAVEDVAALMSSRAREKDLELIVRIQPGLPSHFVGDAGRLRQVITNLVGNSVKFTDRGHILVDIEGESHGGATTLTVKVTDTGIGIPADKLQLVFEKFSQVDGSSTRRHEGTGLGLAITSRLVELMGGAIGVESTPGKGSTFRFSVTLPHAERPVEAKPPAVDVTGARVLIVDDNPVNRAILREQAVSWNLDACAAESGAEALAVLRAAAALGLAVDCVILDYQMPGMTGADVARAIRSDPALASTPIVMLTSVDQSLSTGRYRELGLEAHLLKPTRASVLLETLAGAIRKRRDGAGESAMRPASAEALAAERPVLPRVRPDGQHHLDILVAEDNEVNQLVFAQILAETGLSYEIVGNGELAVSSAIETQPRMILMDISMPKMGGLEAAGLIRRHEAATGAHIPIVGVTAHALKGDRERCLEAGMDDYISKPISPKALLDKVSLWIARAGPLRHAG